MVEVPDCIVLDFETRPIQQRPHYPPRACGVAIEWPGEQPFYMAADHPTENNCTPQAMKGEVARAMASPLPKLFFNAKFDLAVCYETLSLPKLPWQQVHDAMFLAFLCDPHSRALGLKPMAASWLDMPADERNELDEWIMAHSDTLLQTYQWNKKSDGQRKITKSQCGAWIFATPGKLAGNYAIGDIARTKGLFNEMWPLVQAHGMGAAYDRERRLLPILMENEETGIRTDLARLQSDTEGYGNTLNFVEEWLRRELRASGLNFDADADVSALLLERGIVPLDNWQTTDSGKLSMSKDNLLPEHFSGPNGAAIASALGYRNRLKTCLTMFLQPWERQASLRGGMISTNWNQTRGGDSGGTRTGRPSTSDPNLLNISKKWDGRDDGYIHPSFLEVAPLPLCRTYILPDEDEVFLHRDFDGQEMRVFAHFESGALHAAFNADPALDPHAMIGDEMQRVLDMTFGKDIRVLERTKVKTLNFQGLYGGGVPALQRKLRCSAQEAKELKAFHNAALPGRVITNEEIKRITGRGEPIRTWGGRLYYPEPPGADGRSKVYKLINYVTQGSAADLTKEVLIEWHEAKARTARFLVTVYDEINISAPQGTIAVQQMKLLKDVMEEDRLSVPMRSSPKHGLTWGDAKKCPPEMGCLLCK